MNNKSYIKKAYSIFPTVAIQLREAKKRWKSIYLGRKPCLMVIRRKLFIFISIHDYFSYFFEFPFHITLTAYGMNSSPSSQLYENYVNWVFNFKRYENPFMSAFDELVCELSRLSSTLTARCCHLKYFPLVSHYYLR